MKYSTDKETALKQLKKVTDENDAIIKNFCNFVSWWLNCGTYRATPEQLAREIVETRPIIDNFYSLHCWDMYHYNEAGYTWNDLDGYFNKKRRWELKRGLGLVLEHSIVKFHKANFIPCYNNRGRGGQAYDFIYHDRGAFYPIDLKICFGTLPTFQRNSSIYNLNLLMSTELLTTFLESIRDRDNITYRRVITRLKSRIETSSEKKKYILLINPNNKKSLNECQSLRLKAVY